MYRDLCTCHFQPLSAAMDAQPDSEGVSESVLAGQSVWIALWFELWDRPVRALFFKR